MAKARNIRKIWLLGFVLIMVSFGGSAAFALDPMGPPAAGLEQGQFRGALEYSYSEMDLELSKGKWIVYRNGVFSESSELGSLTLEDFRVHKGYASLGYGIVRNWEGFLRLGATRADFGDSIWVTGGEFDGSIDFAVGGGVKATFYEGFDFEIGALAQANWAEFDGKLDAGPWPGPHYVQIDLAEMQIAVGVSYMWTGRVTIYGGPFAHFVTGDFEETFSGVAAGNLVNSELSFEIDDGPIYGGYVGAQVKLFEDCYANAECQLTGEAYALGASLMLRY